MDETSRERARCRGKEAIDPRSAAMAKVTSAGRPVVERTSIASVSFSV